MSKGWLSRLGYRFYRNPWIIFTVGPIYLFLISYRLWPKGARARVKWSVMKTNLALIGVVVLAWFTIGIGDFLLVQVPISLSAAVLGVWLFYVQHQFDGVYWRRTEDWDFFDQALEGSSFYRLPRIFQWFSGNIGFHHIHHLGARIPNYFLEKVQREVELFQTVKPMTIRDSLRCAKFRLFDEENLELVGFARVKELAERARQNAKKTRTAASKLSSAKGTRTIAPAQ
jgi:omega-6 fatty acid desaturase (delta-12 desaturase)